MKIRAVRLREVGLFREAVAIEGFSGGLDVLAGPNELGKSTILGALRHLFRTKPSSRGGEIERLRPHNGGAPLIEADFEVVGHVLRLRKQFLTGKGHAELHDLTTGQVLERGPDAHERALRLTGLSEDDAGFARLLWVNQPDPGQSDRTRRPTVGPDERGLLLSAIEAEVAEVAGGKGLRALRQGVEDELRSLVTAHRPPRPIGDHGRALAEVTRLESELQAARAQHLRLNEQQIQLADMRTRHAALTAPGVLANAGQALTAARHAVETARDAREKRKLAEVTRVSRDSEHRRLDGEARTLRGQLTERDRLGADLTVLAAQLATAETAKTESSATAQAAETRRLACEAGVLSAKETLRRRDLVDTLAELHQRRDEARVAVADHARLSQELSAILATPALVRKAAGEHDAIVQLQALLDAAAPRVSVAYLPGVRDAISADGAALADGAELRPTRPLVLDIAGIGQITIAPVAAFDLGEAQADLDAHRAELEAVLAAIGVADLDAAREALARRRDLETNTAAIAERVTTLARDGLAALETQVAATETALATTVPNVAPPLAATEPPRAVLVQRLQEQEAAHRDAAQAATAALRTATVQAQALTALQGKLENAGARRAALDAELTQMPDPPARLAALDAELVAATTALNAAVRDVAAWQETAPTDAAFAALQAAVTQREHASARSANEAGQLSQAISHLEGQLVGGGDDDVAQRVDELTGSVQRANRHARHFADEVAALALLVRLIDEAEATSQDRFLAPVLARIEPYLRTVLPDARLRLSKELAPSALVRGDAAEHLASLSGGTQEQLAILTRLGFGRLLAEQGQPAPVILDDALVYSDDLRLDRLFEVLRSAAAHHQVIVLTCRARLFEPLGGTRLSITPWKVAP